MVVVISSRTNVTSILNQGPCYLVVMIDGRNVYNPLFGLFNISILLVWMIERARRKKLEALAKETGADLVPSG